MLNYLQGCIFLGDAGAYTLGFLLAVSLMKRSDRPDKLHFHHVIMRSLVILSRGSISQQWANPIATAMILPMMGLPVALGVVYNKNNEVCIALFFGFMWFFTLAHYCVIAVTRRSSWVAESVKKLSFTETN